MKKLFLGFCGAEKPHTKYQEVLNRVCFIGKWDNGLFATLDEPSTYAAIHQAMVEANYSNFDILKEKIVSQDSEIKICSFTKYELSRYFFVVMWSSSLFNFVILWLLDII